MHVGKAGCTDQQLEQSSCRHMKRQIIQGLTCRGAVKSLRNSSPGKRAMAGLRGSACLDGAAISELS